ncbi:c-type cytochrome [Nitratireductor sp. GCM10026969]|uniref:c-type cytochrome n=1 Tax=Nitratireductor sp. GCM10026969 TaxID=3252645 RepID=UPI003621172C
MCIRRSAAGLGLLLACGFPASATDRDTVSALAAGCASCHGTEGRSPGAIPPLAGTPRAVLAARLSAFKAGDDPDATIMSRIAAGYSDDELEALARYFANLTAEEEQ